MHVVRVDLVQRAVPPRIERAPPIQPVRHVGVRQHRVGDGREIAILGGGSGRSREGEQYRRRDRDVQPEK